MRPELSRRLARAVDVGGATAEQRDRIAAAAPAARTFDDLPEPIRNLIVQLEQPPLPAEADAGLRPRARSVLAELGLGDDAVGPDEMVAALIAALDEFEARLDGLELRASWDPEKHPRGPGGRFRSIVSVLVERLDAHVGGKGGGDPFAGFDRDQLQRVARRRGHRLRRGASRDEIVELLLKDLRAKTKPASKAAAGQPKPAGRRPSAPTLGELFAEAGQGGGNEHAMDLKPFQDVVDGDLAGMTARVETATYKPNRPGQTARIQISGSVRAGGVKVGSFVRSFRETSRGIIVSHDWLRLERNVHGSGFANAFNGQLIDWYRRSGVKRVEVHADIDVGGYTWARQGFDFRSEVDANSILNKLRRRLENTSAWGGLPQDLSGAPALDVQIDVARRLLERPHGKFGDPGFPTAYEISQLGRWPGAGKNDMWIGKLVMLGSDWEGVLRL